MSIRKKLSVALLALVCVFSVTLGISLEQKKAHASEIAFTTSNFYVTNKSVDSAPNTFEATVSITDDTGRQGIIFASLNGGNDDNGHWDNMNGFSFEINASKQVRMYFYYYTGSVYNTADFVFSNYALTAGVETHVAVTVTRGSTSSSAILYVNGNQVDTATKDTTNFDTAPLPNTYPITVGNDFRRDNNSTFKGTIKNIACFSDVRTASEISSDYTTLPTSGKDNLLFSYDLSGQGGAKTIKDQANNGYDLKLFQTAGVTLTQSTGTTFSTAGEIYKSTDYLTETPNSFEAWLNIPTTITSTSSDKRYGVIWGNYNDSTKTSNCISFEINADGYPRIYARYNSNDTVSEVVFNGVTLPKNTNFHLAITINRDTRSANCYVNGSLMQTLNLSNSSTPLDSADYPNSDQMAVGGDYRSSSEVARFKGTIYSVAIFSSIRNASEVIIDQTTVYPTSEGLLCLYDFNSVADGENVYDLSGNGRHLTPYTVGTTEGTTFMDDTQYVSSKTPTALPLTYEAWIKMPKTVADSTRGGVILGNYCDNHGNTENNVSFEIYTYGRPRLYIRHNSNDSITEIFFNYDVRTGNKLHLAITLDVTNQTATLYVNGEIPAGCENVALAQNNNATADPLSTNDIPNDHPFVVGNDYRQNPENSYFKGTIYSVATFTDIRTQAEIQADIVSLATTDSNIMLAYNLNSVSGTTVTDISGNGYGLSNTTTGYIVWDSNTTYQTTSAFKAIPKTVEATIKLTNGYSERAGVIFGNYGGASNCFGVEVAANGKIRLYVKDTSGTLTDVSFSTSVATGEWVHITVVINGTTAICYIDGTETATATYSCADFTPTMPYGIGGDLRSGNEQYFKGLIKNITVYSDVRTVDEVKADVTRATVPTSDTNLLCAYNLVNSSDLATIEDLSNNGYDVEKSQYWVTDGSVTDPTDFDYSFAVVGDTQKLVRAYDNYLTGDTTDTFGQSQTFPKIYDYIVNNKDSKKIAHVFGMGDITETGVHWGDSEERSDREYKLAIEQFTRMDDAGIGYSLVRGNHDSWDSFDKWLGSGTSAYATYKQNIDEYYIHPDGTVDYTNSIHYFSAGNLDYMSVTLDYGASDAVLAWAKERILANPYRNAIVTTHAYMFRDGTTLDANDVVPPTNDTSSVYDTSNINNGDDMWTELMSQCPNIVLAMSGHDPCDNIVLSQWQGVNGNIVSNMLIDPQGLDDAYRSEGGVGAVAMFYFSNGGKTVEVRFWSTAKNQYIKTSNQYTFEINTIERPTVTWKNGSTTLETDAEVALGSNPDYNGTTPTKNATAEYTYTFAGWSTEANGTAIAESNLPVVSADTTYYAIFTATKNKYTVTWNVNGTTTTSSVEYGATPTYNGTPTKEATAQYTYTFSGWSPSITTVTGDIAYTAQFSSTVNTYTVTLKNNNGTSDTVLQNVPYGTQASVIYGENYIPTKEGHTFDGWYLGSYKVQQTDTVTSDMELSAIFTVNSYTITWVINGQEYHATVNYGETPICSQSTDKQGYDFLGWATQENGTVLSAIPTATQNQTYYAVYTLDSSTSSTSTSSSSTVENSSNVSTSVSTQTSSANSSNDSVNDSSTVENSSNVSSSDTITSSTENSEIASNTENESNLNSTSSEITSTEQDSSQQTSSNQTVSTQSSTVIITSTNQQTTNRGGCNSSLSGSLKTFALIIMIASIVIICKKSRKI